MLKCFKFLKKTTKAEKKWIEKVKQELSIHKSELFLRLWKLYVKRKKLE